MKALRLLAVVLGLALALGEGYRSFGAGRPVLAWADDFLLAALMITAAVLVRRETVARRMFFTGVWGMAVGGCYLSFISKIIDPASTNAGNMSLGLLTALVGGAFALAVAGFVASLALPFKPSTS